MPGIGEIEQNETAQVQRIIEVAALAQTQIEHCVVDDQSKQEAVKQTVTIGVKALQGIQLIPTQQADWQGQRIGCFDPQIKFTGPGRKTHIKDISQSGQGMLEGCVGITSLPLARRLACLNQINIKLVQLGVFNQEMLLYGLL